MLKKMIDLTGQQFGRLTALSRAGKDKHGNVRWLCSCSCGVQKEVSGAVLRQGKAVSCGCFHSEVASARAKANVKHGMHNTPTYYA